MSYRLQLQLASRIRTERVLSWSCSQAVSKPVWHIPLLCVQWKSPDDGQRNCPKHVEFYSKNKFEKLVHLVGFIIRIYHGARSPERQMITMFGWNIYWYWLQSSQLTLAVLLLGKDNSLLSVTCNQCMPVEKYTGLKCSHVDCVT